MNPFLTVLFSKPTEKFDTPETLFNGIKNNTPAAWVALRNSVESLIASIGRKSNLQEEQIQTLINTCIVIQSQHILTGQYQYQEGKSPIAYTVALAKLRVRDYWKPKIKTGLEAIDADYALSAQIQRDTAYQDRLKNGARPAKIVQFDDIDSEPVRIDETIRDFEALDAAQHILKRLCEKCRQLIMWRYEGVSDEQILKEKWTDHPTTGALKAERKRCRIKARAIAQKENLFVKKSKIKKDVQPT